MKDGDFFLMAMLVYRSAIAYCLATLIWVPRVYDKVTPLLKVVDGYSEKKNRFVTRGWDMMRLDYSVRGDVFCERMEFPI